MNDSFEIGTRKFKVNKIPALKQFHIVRRMGPLLSELGPAIKDMVPAKGTVPTDEQKLEAAAKMIGPIMNGLGKLSDADADGVLMSLLSAVEMQQAQGNWAFLSRDGHLMFQDLELPVLLQAAGKALMFNLSGFFTALPQK